MIRPGRATALNGIKERAETLKEHISSLLEKWPESAETEATVKAKMNDLLDELYGLED